MAKLDNNRKFALVMIAAVVIFLMFIGNLKPAQAPTPVALSTAPIVQPTPSKEEAAKPSADDSISQAIASVIHPLSEKKVTPKLIVYQDNTSKNHYDLSGYMPTGKCIKIDHSWKDNCQEGQKCIRINYDPNCLDQDQSWAGAYWLEPANNWGDQKGGYNLTGAEKLVFWARGEQGGEVIESFKVGGITGDNHKFPDSDTASIGPVTLTKEWQEYSIDLKGKDLSYIVGGFAWMANAQSNSQPITFYLDNIYYE